MYVLKLAVERNKYILLVVLNRTGMARTRSERLEKYERSKPWIQIYR